MTARIIGTGSAVPEQIVTNGLAVVQESKREGLQKKKTQRVLQF